MPNAHPEGKYTNVNCTPITGRGGTLRDGTGTFTESTASFSCGGFAANDLPTVGALYSLNGIPAKKQEDFPGWKCVSAGKTSDFKLGSKSEGSQQREDDPTRTRNQTSTTEKETGMNYSLNIHIDDAGLHQIIGQPSLTLGRASRQPSPAEHGHLDHFQTVERTLCWVGELLHLRTTTEMLSGPSSADLETQDPGSSIGLPLLRGMFNGADGGRGRLHGQQQMNSNGYNSGWRSGGRQQRSCWPRQLVSVL